MSSFKRHCTRIEFIAVKSQKMVENMFRDHNLTEEVSKLQKKKNEISPFCQIKTFVRSGSQIEKKKRINVKNLRNLKRREMMSRLKKNVKIEKKFKLKRMFQSKKKCVN